MGVGDAPAEQPKEVSQVEGADRWSGLSVRGDTVTTILEDVEIDADGNLVLGHEVKEGQYLR